MFWGQEGPNGVECGARGGGPVGWWLGTLSLRSCSADLGGVAAMVDNSGGVCLFWGQGGPECVAVVAAGTPLGLRSCSRLGGSGGYGRNPGGVCLFWGQGGPECVVWWLGTP